MVELKSTNAELQKLTDPKIADAIIKMRDGQIKVKPGYDGEYGVPIIGSMKIKRPKVKIKEGQKGLSDNSY